MQQALWRGVHRVFDGARHHAGRGGGADAGADGLAGPGLLDRGDAVDGILDGAVSGAATEVSFSARGRSCFCASVKVAEVMIMPAVQKPHWKPAASRNCRCMGRRSSGVPSPSMVVTSRPSARNAGAMQRCAPGPVEPDRTCPAIACVATLLDAEPAQCADEGCAGIARGVAAGRTSCRSPCSPSQSRQLGAQLFGVMLGEMLPVVRGAVRVGDTSGGMASMLWARVSASGIDSKANRSRRVVPAVTVSSRSSVSGVRVATAKIVDRPRCVSVNRRWAWRLRSAVGDVDLAEHFAWRKHVFVVAGDEIDCGHRAFGPIGGPERVTGLQCDRHRDHRSGRQRHVDVAADRRRIPDLERREEGFATGREK